MHGNRHLCNLGYSQPQLRIEESIAGLLLTLQLFQPREGHTFLVGVDLWKLRSHRPKSQEY